MEELLDIWELLDFLNEIGDIGELADSAEILDVIAEVDFTNLDIEGIESLSELTSLDDFDAVADSELFDIKGDIGSIEEDYNLILNDNVVIPEDMTSQLTPDGVIESLQSELQNYNSSAIADTSIAYHDTPKIVGSSITYGDYHTGTKLINIHNAPMYAVETLHHEIGHHLFDQYPEKLIELSDMAENNPFLWNDLEAHLSNYPQEDWQHEICAELNKWYQTQPEILRNVAPEIFEKLQSFIPKA